MVSPNNPKSCSKLFTTKETFVNGYYICTTNLSKDVRLIIKSKVKIPEGIRRMLIRMYVKKYLFSAQRTIQEDGEFFDYSSLQISIERPPSPEIELGGF